MKVAGPGLEDFMDWESIISIEPAKEEEMSRLPARFSSRMCKRDEGSVGESTPIFDRKLLNRSSPDEDTEKDWAIISVDSLNLAFIDQPILEGTPSEAGAPLEDGILVLEGGGGWRGCR